MAGAAIDQPLRRREAEAAQAPRDEMGAIGVDREFGRRIARPDGLGRRRTDEDLADMSRLLHEPHRLDDLGVLEDGERRRRQFARGEQGHDLVEQPARDVRSRRQKLVEIDPEIAEIAPERTEPDRRVDEVIALSEFDEPSERPQQAEAALHRLARQRIEDDRNAFSFRHAHHVVDEGAGAGIEGVLGAEGKRKGALFRRPRGDDGARPAPNGDLERREPDAARAAMDERPFARLEARAGNQPVVGGEKGDRNGAGAFAAERRGKRRNEARVHHDVGGERAADEAYDRIARLQMRDSRRRPERRDLRIRARATARRIRPPASRRAESTGST